MRVRIPVKATKSLAAAWSRGIPLVDEAGKKIKGLAPFEGFFFDTGLDPAVDSAAEDAGWQRGWMNHMGADRPVEHWLIPTPALAFVLLSGLPDLGDAPIDNKTMGVVARAGAAMAQIGLRARWPDGGRSTLAVQVIWADLLRVGYAVPMVVSVKSNYTTDLLTCLFAHDATLAQAEAASAAKGTPTDFNFYDIACSFVPGDSEVRGVGTTTSEVTPLRYAPPANVEALRAQHYRSFEPERGWLHLQVDLRWAEIVVWAGTVAEERAE